MEPFPTNGAWMERRGTNSSAGGTSNLRTKSVTSKQYRCSQTSHHLLRTSVETAVQRRGDHVSLFNRKSDYSIPLVCNRRPRRPDTPPSRRQHLPCGATLLSLTSCLLPIPSAHRHRDSPRDPASSCLRPEGLNRHVLPPIQRAIVLY